MRKMSVLALAPLCVLLIVAAASAAPLAPDYTKIGVEVGDVAIYRLADEAHAWNKTRVLIYGILGTVVTFNRTSYNPNGSVGDEAQYAINVKTGIGTIGHVYAANLTAGDPIHFGHPVTINETIQMVVAGALRSINHLNYYGGHLNMYWDRVTGLVTEFHYHVAYWENFTLLSTTAWAPDTVPSLLNMTTIVVVESAVIIVLVIVLILLASRRRRS